LPKRRIEDVTVEYKRDACEWCEGKEYCRILQEEPDCENCPIAMQCVRTPQFSEGNCDHMQEQWLGVLSPKVETDKGTLVPDLQRKIVCQLARELLLENLQQLQARTASGPVELTVCEGIFSFSRPHITHQSMWNIGCPRCARSALVGYVMRLATPAETAEGNVKTTAQISMVCRFCGLDEKVDVP
jgi:hypothetical protein